MIDISLEKRQERYDAVSQSLRDALNSETIDGLLWLIAEVHHLGEERTFKLVRIYGLIVLGFIHPQDLQKEIVSELQIDKRLADEIAHELQVKILNPLMPEINAAFNYHITGIAAPRAASTAPLSLTQPEIIRPSFAPGEQEREARERELEVNQARPFILHEEQKETESVRPIDETLVRPTFYDPPSREVLERQIGQEASGRPMAARLEIGGVEEGSEAEPRVGRTETEKIRVVHYSGPQTSIDPFAPQQRAGDKEQKVDPQPLSKDIHPENVVDLKDLPK